MHNRESPLIKSTCLTAKEYAYRGTSFVRGGHLDALGIPVGLFATSFSTSSRPTQKIKQKRWKWLSLARPNKDLSIFEPIYLMKNLTFTLLQFIMVSLLYCSIFSWEDLSIIIKKLLIVGEEVGFHTLRFPPTGQTLSSTCLTHSIYKFYWTQR